LGTIFLRASTLVTPRTSSSGPATFAPVTTRAALTLPLRTASAPWSTTTRPAAAARPWSIKSTRTAVTIAAASAKIAPAATPTLAAFAAFVAGKVLIKFGVRALLSPRGKEVQVQVQSHFRFALFWRLLGRVRLFVCILDTHSVLLSSSKNIHNAAGKGEKQARAGASRTSPRT
jgi:hypothetical protein